VPLGKDLKLEATEARLTALIERRITDAVRGARRHVGGRGHDKRVVGVRRRPALTP
jgi:hypothetical protein